MDIKEKYGIIGFYIQSNLNLNTILEYLEYEKRRKWFRSSLKIDNKGKEGFTEIGINLINN